MGIMEKKMETTILDYIAFDNRNSNWELISVRSMLSDQVLPLLPRLEVRIHS